jgi:hypothetical protein
MAIAGKLFSRSEPRSPLWGHPSDVKNSLTMPFGTGIFVALGGAEFCQPCVRYLRSDFLKYIVTSVNSRFFTVFLLFLHINDG